MRLAWTLPVVACLTACAGPTFMDSDPPLPKAADVGELRRQLLQIMEEEAVPGMAVGLVTSDGTQWMDALGFANLETRQPIQTAMPFRCGSITKTLMGLAVMRLFEERKLDLDATVSTLLPEVEFHNPFEADHPLRLVHLLEHTSGFDDSRPMEFLVEGNAVPTLLEALAVNPRPRVSRWPPGSRHSYANPSYTMVGAVLEKTTGQRFEDHLRDRVLVPLGMEHATLSPSTELLARLPQGYVGSKRLVQVAYNQILHRPAGNLVATLDDVLKLARYVASDGAPLLRQETLESMQQPRSLQGVPLSVGFGMGIQRWQVDGWQVAGHGGNVDGFSSSYGRVVGQTVAFAILTNANNAHGAMERVQSALLGLALKTPPPQEPEVTLTSEQKDAVTGFYQGACPRTKMLQFVDHLLGWRRIVDEDGQLWMHGFARTPQKLTPVSPNRFRLPDEGAAGWHLSDGGMLFTGTRCFQKEAAWPRTLERGFVFAVIPAVMSPLLWPLTQLRRRRNGAPRDVLFALTGAFSMLGCLALLGTLKGLYQFSPILNGRTLGFFLLPLVFAGCALLGLVDSSARLRTQGFSSTRLYALLWSVAAVAGALYMARWDQLGMALWAY